MNEAGACSASEPSEPSEPLSWHEICRRYADEWVALVETDWVDEDQVHAARVAGHGPRRMEPVEQARHLHARTRRSVISSPDASSRGLHAAFAYPARSA